jgi:hypothetical protein
VSPHLEKEKLITPLSILTNPNTKREVFNMKITQLTKQFKRQLKQMKCFQEECLESENFPNNEKFQT